MPPAVPIVAAVAAAATTTAVTAATGLAIAGSLAGFVVAAGVSILGASLINKKPKAPSFSKSATGFSTMVRSSVESHKVVYGEARISGPVNFPTTTSSGRNSAGTVVTGNNRFFHFTIPLAGHEIDSVTTVYLNDQALTLNASGFATNAPYLKNGLSYVRVKTHLGMDSQTADPDLMSECGVNSNFRGQGIAYVYIRLEWNVDVFPTGIPNVSVVVKGKKVYDPRTNTTAWSDNPALCIRDYLTSEYGFDCLPDEINDDYFISAANACDEEVALSGGGNQARFTCNGIVDTAVGPLDNLNSLLSSLVGTVTYVQGKFRLHVGVYHTPEGELTTDMLAGPVKIRIRTPRSELFNAVKGTYVDPDKNWQPTDFPPVTNGNYEDQDGGQRITRDIELPFTNHPEAAQRIAKINLEKARQGIVVEMPVTDAALRYTAFDVVTFTNEQLGWDSKAFRILKWSTSALGAITLTMQEEAASSYDWNSGEATSVDTAPDTNLPDPFTVTAPSGVAFSSRAVETAGGDTLYNLVLSWMEHPDMFVRDGGGFEVQFKLSSESSWRSSFRVNGDLTEADVITTSVNVSYDLRIRAISSLSPNIRSSWVTLTGAIAGSSGGVGTTNDWGNWTEALGPTIDYGEWVSSPGATNDWGFFS